MLHPTRPTTQHLIKHRLFVSLAMANSFTLLADIKAGRCSTTAEVRLLRFWEAPNVKRGSKLMGVNMLLIDKQSTLMEGSVSVNPYDQSIVLLINSEILSRCERMVTIVLMMLYAWRESSSIQGISNGDNKTDVELPDGVRGELRESTNANHQPSSYVVPGGGRLA
ncbi:unnamed protein product [Brassica oleracea]|uniref:(rape) hypothetical protein n=1 Tax=Brassica napus TaxID=3708 RepID=A0A816LVE1_BRANA|nr:unnamed protein product [Brassica napus]